MADCTNMQLLYDNRFLSQQAAPVQVADCTNMQPHDWTLCAYAHTGEKARRRDTAVYAYVASACPDFRKAC